MGIKHDPEIAAGHVSKINGKLSNLKNSPKADSVSYSNLYGVTKGVTANNKYLKLIGDYQKSLTEFSKKINEVSQKFEELDKSVKFGDGK
ncbi:TIGR04197 family type VII secretion effector [Lactococcus cremoris]|uniref:TIGR04197 family type VII secretion effector n=1 Tax=Lactococcus lactis subsp. cremoris TaxID=1359 RepID=A0AAX4AL58_LACLC|nr:TIGR04197 family type VII secretion effector [Lactococcus cremoris]KGH34166.1 hypothetical protein JL36_05320 [Lactococcus cremoris]QSE63902.1 TIGR04197 family type VII secretion effector [Lactococcus cremoris]WMX71861.1 TIGR04197 family type VII secretion effector [Lactococcus cremoris]